jgi:hypothetical protein
LELAARKLRKRLVVKSMWFRSQLIKMEAIVNLSAQMDVYLRPELTCPQCLELFKFPMLLHPCGRQGENSRIFYMICAQLR